MSSNWLFLKLQSFDSTIMRDRLEVDPLFEFVDSRRSLVL